MQRLLNPVLLLLSGCIPDLPSDSGAASADTDADADTDTDTDADADTDTDPPPPRVIVGDLELDDADAARFGAAPGMQVGVTLAAGRDVTGDGYDDMLYGSSGAVWIDREPVSDSTTVSGFVIVLTTGVYARAVLGDVTGDGIADVVANSTSDDEEPVYLYEGPVTASTDAEGADDSWAGGAHAAAAIHDVDADGRDDALLFSIRSTSNVTVELDLSAVRGVDWTLTQSGCATYAFQDEADVTGDGVTDLLLSLNCGVDYPLYLVDPTEIAGDTSIEDVAIATGNFAPSSSSLAKDIDGDGHGDILLGSSTADDGGRDNGAVYINRGPFSGDVLGTSTDRVLGAADDAMVGGARTGDFDGDGVGDIVAGSLGVGEVWVLYGPLSGVTYTTAAQAHLVNDSEALLYASTQGDLAGDGCDELTLADTTAEAAAGGSWFFRCR